MWPCVRAGHQWIELTLREILHLLPGRQVNRVLKVGSIPFLLIQGEGHVSWSHARAKHLGGRLAAGHLTQLSEQLAAKIKL